MPLPRLVARANRVGLNRLTRHVAPCLPGFGVIVHRGRRSGRTYRTPVNVFRFPGGRLPDGYVVALTYGRDADWVRNVLAAGGAELHTRGRRVTVRTPRVYRDRSRAGVPAPVRPVLGLLGVTDFLALRGTPPDR